MQRVSWVLTLFAIVLMSTAAISCTGIVLPKVANSQGGGALPPVIGISGSAAAIPDATQWREQRVPALRQAFEANVYGKLPVGVNAHVIARKTIPDITFDGRADVEQVTLGLGENNELGTFNLVTVVPASRAGPVPIIITQNFCGNPAAFGGHPAIDSPFAGGGGPCDSAFGRFVASLIFGRYAAHPPFEKILERGYAVGLFYPGEVVPDNGARGIEALKRLSSDPEGPDRLGAIGAWAWLFSKVVDYLDADERFDKKGTAVWGHSRNGKSALVAGAFDERIDMVIAHQSGRGGASLTRHLAGESVAQITTSYPHWFAPAYADYADGREKDVPVDQHELIAMVAPRPVLLGNAWRDAWSDPKAAYLAVQAADAVYELFGSEGVDQSSMAAENLGADLAFFMRPGFHGVNGRDWNRFLKFMDYHFRDDRG